MFEEDSKEYANKWLGHVKDLELQHKSDDKPEYIRILEAHQKGAVFGYNKGKNEAKEIIENLLGLLPDEVLYHDYYKRTYIEPAEQFLKESE